MKIYENILEEQEQIIVESNNRKFIIGWFGADLYWVMPDYSPNNHFTITKDCILWGFFKSLFSKYHFKNNTFTWVSEARLPNESSTLKITKGKDFFRIRFIQGEDDYLARASNICPICFCLSGSRNQEIANEFSNLLHELLSRDYT